MALIHVPRSVAGRSRRVAALACIAVISASCAGGCTPRIGLWNGRAPLGPPGEEAGAIEEADAFLTVYLPQPIAGAPAAPTPAAVICPGGGYGVLVTAAEGHGIAAWLVRHGIAGMVLEYRLPKGRPFVPALDAARAVRMVRARAEEWRIDPTRVGIIGFSAGGHLASIAATRFDDDDRRDGAPLAGDPVERQSARPDFAILVYPVITMGEEGHDGSRRNLLGDAPTRDLVERFSSERQVTPQTPPTFLAHAVDDTVVPIGNSRAFHEACRRAGVESRLLELPSGGHGLDGYKGPNWDAWQEKSLEWLGGLGIVHAAGHR